MVLEDFFLISGIHGVVTVTEGSAEGLHSFSLLLAPLERWVRQDVLEAPLEAL